MLRFLYFRGQQLGQHCTALQTSSFIPWKLESRRRDQWLGPMAQVQRKSAVKQVERARRDATALESYTEATALAATS